MRKLWLFLALPLLFMGCKNNKQSFTFSSVSQKSIIRLHKKKGQGNIHALTISGQGQINGSAVLTLILNKKPYRTVKLSGNAKFTWTSDWYADSLKLQYTPTKVQGGKLVLNYVFKD